MATQFVRVRDKVTGHHYSTSEALAKANPDRYERIGQPAADINGRPLDPKPNIKQTRTKAADTSKEATK